jgi:hypothetical protein
VAQGVGPVFKSQYHKKKKKRERKETRYLEILNLSIKDHVDLSLYHISFHTPN